MDHLSCGDRVEVTGQGLAASGVVTSCSMTFADGQLVIRADLLLTSCAAAGTTGACVVRGERGQEYRCLEWRMNQSQELLQQTTLNGIVRVPAKTTHEMNVLLMENTGAEAIIKDDWMGETSSLLDEILK